MFHAFRNASAKRSEALKKKKTREDDEVVLELKKSDILQQAKAEAEELGSEVKKLKQTPCRNMICKLWGKSATHVITGNVFSYCTIVKLDVVSSSTGMITNHTW
ncbi:hypothetical protein PR048_020810 [Dryococelus australis]|uniref:Uncharacterized protein n=1 Tax=Dryococelus australis TaxID=614101 RepID=A0ABQ9GWG0_9NEOP|nr:hypothetical protein PR048_020810 [Dryococelus australis]